ncbi:DUF1810 domain-containing protein [Pseudomonas akapageensis]|uniref:DUF1810 domain-containing protein n=1 Tax=Pseudomonas akapageensis TaxID=2609961 RepID=UPI00140E52C0|nr:DUF1810 domain-containing protein [Pseudomonas akapageensis]
MSDPYDLQRFVDAQEPTFERAMEELRTGHKRSHWMWFIFPQLEGLGHSEMAWRYAICDRKEALAYLDHPLLGTRLEACTRAVIELQGRTAREIFGTPDDLKLRSCMTLFATVAPEREVFQQVLDGFYQGKGDVKTLSLLGEETDL